MVILTATLPQYANGNFFLQAQGSNISEIAGSLNTFGVFSAPIQSNLAYGITMLPPSGTSYSRFGTTFTSQNGGTQDISALLIAATPPPLVTGGLLLTPTTDQTVNQPDNTTLTFNAGTGADAAQISATDNLIAVDANTIALLANADGAGDPGSVVIQAATGSSSGSIAAMTGSVIQLAGIVFEDYRIVSSDTTIDYTFTASCAIIDASLNDVILTLPNELQLFGGPFGVDTMELPVVRYDFSPSANTVTVMATSPSTIQGEASITLPNKTCVTLLGVTDPNTGNLIWIIQTDNRPA